MPLSAAQKITQNVANQESTDTQRLCRKVLNELEKATYTSYYFAFVAVIFVLYSVTILMGV